MEGIDKMTMELLMNKKKYNKYISKNDPELHNKKQQEFAKMQKYAARILDLTEGLLTDPNMEVKNDVNEMFIQYVKTCMYHFETKDMELAGCRDSYENGNYDDENTLFGECEQDADSESEKESEKVAPTPKSYWGKSIQKVGSSNIDSFFQPKNKII